MKRKLGSESKEHLNNKLMKKVRINIARNIRKNYLQFLNQIQ